MESLIIGYASQSNTIKGKAVIRSKLGGSQLNIRETECYPINLN